MGKFLTFEGGEGVGKSTQIKRLAELLEAHGSTVILTREPGGTAYGKRMRNLILEHSDEQLCSLSELLLYVADRAQHVEQVIKPALKQGYWVLCDRYIDSTVAYQAFGRQLELDTILQLNQIATSGLKPEITFWLDLDPVRGLDRLSSRSSTDRLENEALAFHQRTYQGYQWLYEQEKQRFEKIDASLSEEQVFESILNVLYQRGLLKENKNSSHLRVS